MEFENLISYTFRWIHMFAGVIWIGLLYYFNFVQTEYFKETSPEGNRLQFPSWYQERSGGFVMELFSLFYQGLSWQHT